MPGQGLSDFSDPPISSSQSEQSAILQAPASSSNGLMHFISLVHRLAVFAIAIFYLSISLQAFSTAMIILHHSVSHNLPIDTYKASLILGYAGSSTIQASPLVQQVLHGSTSPLNTSIYLESPVLQSSTGCSNVPNYNADIYSNTFLRFIYSRLQMYASHNLSYVTELDLVAPIIDCTFDLLTAGDTSAIRVYYLVRRNGNETEVMLLSTSLSTQDYVVEKQYQQGPATLVLVAAIRDVRTTIITHDIAIAYNYPYVAEPEFAYSKLQGIDHSNCWLLETLANPQTHDPAKDVRTVRHRGRYIGHTTAQSNIEFARWDLPVDPVTELGSWSWHTRAVLFDTWAWTHAIHGFFALDIIFNFSVLSFVTYRCMRTGQFWVGDAFTTISSRLFYRGVLVILCNFLNRFWTITNMCLSTGASLTGQHALYYRSELAHADLLAIFLCGASLLCYVTRERVDPLIVFATFEFGWRFRVELSAIFVTSRIIIASFAMADATNGLLKVNPNLARLSPMDLITAYEVVKDRHVVTSVAVMSIFSPIMVIAAYIAVQKARRYVNMVQRGQKVKSSAYAMNPPQRKLTSFEVATGAALTERSGILLNYDNYTMWNHRLAATHDAVYGNGFVIVKEKFLVGIQDLLPLLVMKLTRVRFTNIFVYEIKDASFVRATADLVYPSTISWDDLRHIQITRLA